MTDGWSRLVVDCCNSKNDIYSSKVHYMIMRGKPYLWVQEGDMHNMFPPRVALAGDIRLLNDDKVVTESLAESVVTEHETVDQASYAVSAILIIPIANLFGCRSCTHVDGSGGTHDVEPNEVKAPEADLLSKTYGCRFML
ncbi:hypothetical protein BHE74_00008496 [Ensete ventricosum]|nr:hypothetical protein GW17_00000699 [Ensete ventricosum]RWW83017.1 hypothetical protein BHE74_00008496 [Ensete ventricosum]RZR76366.1 hypothetical protein BHM03_00001138 [Ensete ventricosum]